MIIKDAKGAYSFNVDSSKNIIRYAMKGMWDMDDFNRFMSDYKEALTQVKKPWAAVVDVREQKLSLKVSSDKMNEVNIFAAQNGVACAAVITSSAILKMTVNRTVSSNGLDVKMVDNENDAEAFIKSKGF